MHCAYDAGNKCKEALVYLRYFEIILYHLHLQWSEDDIDLYFLPYHPRPFEVHILFSFVFCS